MKQNPAKSIGDKLDAENIVLVVENDQNLRRQFDYLSARLNVLSKAGIFDAEKAKKMFMHLADAGAREATRLVYRKPADEYSKYFSAETRRMAAGEFVAQYLSDNKPVKKEKYQDYKYIVVDDEYNIIAGNEFREDAVDAKNDLKDHEIYPRLRVVTSKYYKQQTGKDNRDSDNWKNP